VISGVNLATVYDKWLQNRQVGGGKMEERRVNKTERRQRTEKLPIKDNNGAQVALERRYFPDRRTSHFNPKW